MNTELLEFKVKRLTDLLDDISELYRPITRDQFPNDESFEYAKNLHARIDDLIRAS